MDQSMDPESSMTNITMPGASCCITSRGTSEISIQEASTRDPCKISRQNMPVSTKKTFKDFSMIFDRIDFIFNLPVFGF
jgi:hypothetical protein